MWFNVLFETAFIVQNDCCQVGPCVFCKCYLHAVSVFILPTEFIKHLFWVRYHAGAGKRETLRSVNGEAQCPGQRHDGKVHRDLGEHYDGGAQSRLGVEIGQRGKTTWPCLEIHVEVGEGVKQRSSLCTVRSGEDEI